MIKPQCNLTADQFLAESFGKVGKSVSSAYEEGSDAVKRVRAGEGTWKDMAGLGVAGAALLAGGLFSIGTMAGTTGASAFGASAAGAVSARRRGRVDQRRGRAMVNESKNVEVDEEEIMNPMRR